MTPQPRANGRAKAGTREPGGTDMKVAEALLLRADMQKKVESLRDRITKNVLIQEGEQPSENPEKLLKEVNQISDGLRDLVFKINKANISSKTNRGRSLTEAIAESAREYADTIYKKLQQEYEWLCSDVVMLEHFENNDINFDEEGEVLCFGTIE
jgi:2-iminoacetate synthase ThiH